MKYPVFVQGSRGAIGQKGVAGVDGEEVDWLYCIDYLVILLILNLDLVIQNTGITFLTKESDVNPLILNG